MDKSQSFESGRDESRPILGVGPAPGVDIPKCSGTHFRLFSRQSLNMRSVVYEPPVFSRLEGASQTPGAQAEERRCSDHQDNGANEEAARVRGGR